MNRLRRWLTLPDIGATITCAMRESGDPNWFYAFGTWMRTFNLAHLAGLIPAPQPFRNRIPRVIPTMTEGKAWAAWRGDTPTPPA